MATFYPCVFAIDCGSCGCFFLFLIIAQDEHTIAIAIAVLHLGQTSGSSSLFVLNANSMSVFLDASAIMK